VSDIERTYIWVTKWEDHQSYSIKRGKPWAPPWIKLYPRLLDDPDFMGLPAETRSLLVGIWALFARSRGTLTKDTRNLSRQLSQRVTERQLERLNHAGFIQFCSGTVREQLWNTFWNSSALEVEVDKEPPNPRRRGGTKPSQKTTPKPPSPTVDQTPDPELPPPEERHRLAAELRAQLLGAQATATAQAEAKRPTNGHEPDLLDAGYLAYLETIATEDE